MLSRVKKALKPPTSKHQHSKMEQMELLQPPVFFFAGDNEFACFSNFYPSKIVVNEKEWLTVEHYFQAMKSTSESDQESVRAASTPGRAKRMGRSLPLREDWDKIKTEVMMKGLRAKFKLSPFRETLLKSGDRFIYEDSPYDNVWGTGVLKSEGNGQNLLGKMLMALRAEIKS